MERGVRRDKGESMQERLRKKDKGRGGGKEGKNGSER